jgi:hypothetical protein
MQGSRPQSRETNHAVPGPGHAEAVVAETMAAHQQDQGQRLAVNGLPRLSEVAGRHCTAGPQRGGAPTGKRNGRYRRGRFTQRRAGVAPSRS